MEVKRHQHRTRTRLVSAATAQELEDGLNTALEVLEGAGQDILSVQIFPVAHAAGAFTAFVIYTDNVGLDIDFTQRHTERDQEKDRKALAQLQRVEERRALQDAALMEPPAKPVSTPGT